MIGITRFIQAVGQADGFPRTCTWVIGLAFAGLIWAAALGAAADPTLDSPASSEDDTMPPGIKSTVQGPAISAPREIFHMLEQRKRFLDQREAALRGADTRLFELKAELDVSATSGLSSFRSSSTSSVFWECVCFFRRVDRSCREVSLERSDLSVCEGDEG